MTPEQYTSIGFLIVKTLSIVGFILYAIYAAVMVRQEQLMSKVLAETSEGSVRVLAVIHLIAAVLVIILALILL